MEPFNTEFDKPLGYTAMIGLTLMICGGLCFVLERVKRLCGIRQRRI